MNDLISRQTAIKAFKKELTAGESKGKYVTICSAIGYGGAKRILESLPSANPEWNNHTVALLVLHHQKKMTAWSESSSTMTNIDSRCTDSIYARNATRN